MSNLTPAEKAVLDIYRSNPEFTVKQVAGVLKKKSINSIWKPLKRLQKKGFVELKEIRQFVHLTDKAKQLPSAL